MQASTSVVTEEYHPPKRHVVDAKTHMITVQPLKRSEMQVRSPQHLPALDKLTTPPKPSYAQDLGTGEVRSSFLSVLAQETYGPRCL